MRIGGAVLIISPTGHFLMRKMPENGGVGLDRPDHFR